MAHLETGINILIATKIPACGRTNTIAFLYITAKTTSTHKNPPKDQWCTFCMIAFFSFSVYSLSMCVFAVRLMHPTSHRRLQSFAGCTSEGIKSDEWATSSVVSGGKRKSESSDIICNNFSDGLKNRGRKIRTHSQEVVKHISTILSLSQTENESLELSLREVKRG